MFDKHGLLVQVGLSPPGSPTARGSTCPLTAGTTFCVQGREQKVDSHQEPFAHRAPEHIPKTFVEAVNVLRPSAIIGERGRVSVIWVLAAFTLFWAAW